MSTAGSNSTVTTAHLHWDRVWGADPAAGPWATADPWVAGTVPLLRARGAVDVLDLGCGLGRHAIRFAEAGFAVSALDRSETGLRHAREVAAGAGLSIRLTVGNFDQIPFPDASFDVVLAFNVVYHGDEPAVRRAVDEVRRVLRPGGLYQCTMLSKRNREYGRGIEVARNAFVQPDATDDKIHPHVYCDPSDLLRLHAGLDLLSAHDREHATPGSFHWHCLFERPGGQPPAAGVKHRSRSEPS
jgi:SAM-dependent methyltransferase